MAFVLVLLFLTGLALSVWRLLDHRADLKAMHELAVSQPAQPPTFTADMVAHLPEPARRYFLYTIKPGTQRLAAMWPRPSSGHRRRCFPAPVLSGRA